MQLYTIPIESKKVLSIVLADLPFSHGIAIIAVVGASLRTVISKLGICRRNEDYSLLTQLLELGI